MLPSLLSGTAERPLRILLAVLALAPEYVWHAFALLAFICMVSYLLRTVLLVEAPLNRWAHMGACVLTLSPAFTLAAVLWWAAYQYPARAWLNLGVTAGLFAAWWAGGAITRLARPDTEGGDIGWITMGALITFPIGALAALIYR